MKKLLLIRHAKAVHAAGYTDFERPLKRSGLQDAAVMAARLQEHSIIPQILISSPALRTIATANIFAEHLSLPKPETDRDIYEADQGALAAIVNELPDAHSFIGLVGHNPGISDLLYYLTAEVRGMATCSLVLIEFDVNEWKAIGHNSGKLLYDDSPVK
jgi:phosphohistidine phosphatase